MAKKGRRKVVLTIPEMGLTKKQMGALKKRFKTELVNTLGGREALVRADVVVEIEIEIVVVEF